MPGLGRSREKTSGDVASARERAFSPRRRACSAFPAARGTQHVSAPLQQSHSLPFGPRRAGLGVRR